MFGRLQGVRSWLFIALLIFVGMPGFCLGQDFAVLKKDLIEGDRETRREAALALGELGEGALPALPELIEATEDDDEQVAGRAVMAIAAIGPNAPDAIPVLIENLDPRRRRYDEQVVYRTAFALGKIGPAAVGPLRKALGSSSRQRRFGAVQALLLIGANAEPAIPELIKVLRDEKEETRDAAGEALAAIGGAAFEPLKREFEVNSSVAVVRALGRMGGAASGMSDQLLALNPTEKELSAAIIETLGRMGVPLVELRDLLKRSLLDGAVEVRTAGANLLLTGDGGLEILEGWLRDEDRELRQRAVWVVGQFGADAAHLAPELISLIGRGDGRDGIVKALSGLGAGATGAILEVVGKERLDALRDGDEPHWAIEVLRSAGPLAMPQLESALGSESAAEKYVALDSLAQLGTVTKSLAAKFRKATGDAEPVVRLAALVALDASGAEPRRMATILHRRCADESGDVRAVAVGLLGEIGAEDGGAFAKIDKALGDEDAGVRAAAIVALANFGSEAQGSVAKLTELVEGAGNGTRLAILNTLAAIGRGGAEAMPFVKKSLGDDDAGVRGAAVNALVAIESSGDDLAEVLSEMLEDEDVAVRHPAIEGLGKMGEDAEGAAPKLFELLESNDDRREALDALRRIKSHDVDLYITALENDEPRVRLFACEALGRLGKEAERAIPQLEQARKDRYDFVRRRAADAIKRIRDS